MAAGREIDRSSLDAVEGRIINQRNSAALERVRPPWAPEESLDAAIVGRRDAANGPQAPSVTPPAIGSFEGLSVLDNLLVGLPQVNPPDTNADVSYNQIVETVNLTMRVYDKSGAPLTPVLKQSDLFEALGGQCAETDPGDPIVLHDRMADRWNISQFNFANGAAVPFFQCIAISKTNDAAGEYYLYEFQTPFPNFPDYPKLGVWNDAYYMSTRQFNPSPSQFRGLGAFAFNRAKMLAGDPSAEQIFIAIPLDANYPSGTSSGMIPADHDGFIPPPAGAPNIFAIYDSDEFGAADEVRLFNFHADFTTPANSTFLERAESPIAVPAFDDRVPGGRAHIEQPPPGENLDSIADRLMFRMSYRILNGVESLTTNHTVNVSGVNPTNAATFQAANRYYELRTPAVGGAYAVHDAATFAPDSGNGATGLNRWMGSTAIDHQGNLGSGYSISSTTQAPGIAYVGREFNLLGDSITNEVVLFPGQGTQAAGSGNRWGDYTSMSVDPADDCTFWHANEYYPPGNTAFNWRTRIGSFKFASCTAPPQGTLSGSVTACDSGAPIGEVLITVTGGPSEGFSAATADDGTYSLRLAPGTYTVTASSAIRNCAASASAVVTITDTGTATFNTCLDGDAKTSLPENDPAPATVSGGNGNGQIERGECNTLNVNVQNIGCAPARNVVATLSTTTPGVIITEAESAYPDMPIDGVAGNLTPFEISTSPAFTCGTTINFALTTTYEGGSDVMTFSLETCEAAPVNFSGTIAPTDPTIPNGRLGRNAVPSTCSGKACPGPLGMGPRSYDTHSFVNSGGVPACVTIDVSIPGCGTQMFAAAYLNSFDPTNLCTNYLGDAGSSSANQRFDATVPPGQTLVVVIMNADNATLTCAYSGTVSGLISNNSGTGACAANLTTQVNDDSILLGEDTFDTATLSGAFDPTGSLTFRLYGPDDSTCAGTPVFTSIQTVNGNSVYSSTPFTPSTAGVYRWTASYSGDGVNPASASACNDPNETVTVSAFPTPTPTPSPVAAQPQNLASRAQVGTTDRVMIGGFIITGTVAKDVLIRGLGPSLEEAGITGALVNPTLELRGSNGALIRGNQDWKDTQEAQIRATGIPPTFNVESAIVANLAPGSYTAILAGLNGGTGLGLIEIYDIGPGVDSQLGNLSTRAFVGTGQNVLIGGFILGEGEGDGEIVIRALGPSLAAAGVSNTLADPFLELRDSNGLLIQGNDNWNDVPAEAAELTAKGFAPSNTNESAIITLLPPGTYTAIVRGTNATTGVGLVEIYNRR
jgi:hypothetical protein